MKRCLNIFGIMSSNQNVARQDILAGRLILKGTSKDFLINIQGAAPSFAVFINYVSSMCRGLMKNVFGTRVGRMLVAELRCQGKQNVAF